jgi:hypothetical protein
MITRSWRRRTIAIASATLIPLGAVAITGPAAAGTSLAICATQVPSDFNGDGYADVAMGLTGDTINGAVNAGAVRVEYGSATGPVAATQQYFDRNSPNINGAPTFGDEFSEALAAGDFNRDCYADLAIGTPGQGNVDNNGDVTILYGSPAGLTTTGAAQFAGRSSGGRLGFALAAGDFNHDGYADLAAGAPNAVDNGMPGAGEIGIAFGSGTGLAAPTQWINQSTTNVPGAAEVDDHFGWSLVAADFTGDGYVDLVVGSPFEDNGSVRDGGAITVLHGSATGIAATAAQGISQATGGVPGTASQGDQFGFDLAAGDVDGDGHPDLVVGAPFKAVSGHPQAGQIVYLRGSTTGVTTTGAHYFNQGTSGVAGAVGDYHAFGFSLTLGDFDGDGHGEIAIGNPFDEVTVNVKVNGITVSSSRVVSGTVTVLKTVGGVPTGTGSLHLSQQTSGVPGTAEQADGFGERVRAAYLHGGTQADLVVGVPYESTGQGPHNGMVQVAPGTATGITGAGSVNIFESVTAGGIIADGGGFGCHLG